MVLSGVWFRWHWIYRSVWGIIDILTTPSLLNHEYDIAFPIFRSSLISLRSFAGAIDSMFVSWAGSGGGVWGGRGRVPHPSPEISWPATPASGQSASGPQNITPAPARGLLVSRRPGAGGLAVSSPGGDSESLGHTPSQRPAFLDSHSLNLLLEQDGHECSQNPSRTICNYC